MTKILENDLHRSRSETAAPLIIEVPAIPEFLPSIVSNSAGEFLISRKLTGDNRIRIGVFKYDLIKIDGLIAPMLNAALNLSIAEKWPNVFGSQEIKAAFSYIKKTSCVPVQPHVCLCPDSWGQDKIERTFGCGNDEGVLRYGKHCRLIFAPVSFVCFLSKPDMVGLYTRFLNGAVSLLLHNVKKGMAFCT